MKKIFVITLLTGFLAISCGKSSKPVPVRKENKLTPAITVILQPLGHFPEKELQDLYKRLLTVLPDTKLVPAIDLPSSAYYKARGRYRADSLIHILSSFTPDNKVTIGVTDKDISTTKGLTADWGVMGLGYCPGSACVISTFRLKKANKADQLFKVAIHELGHTQGLPHCENKTCYMRDAEGHNTTDEEISFCENCRKRLVEKGWHLNKLQAP